MRINTNLSSLNTQGRLNAAQTGMSKSLEKLSSGLRIGRASDDAAGLSISEKMRGQIKGLDRAQKNATEAISLIQTAEGALNESHNILQRMRELAGQASSDSATASDRNEMQKEVDALAKELTRITNTTQFNTKNLLGGSFSGQKFQIGANTNQDIDLSIAAMDAKSLSVTADKGVSISDGTAIKSGNLSSASSLSTGSYSIDMKVASATFSSLTGVGQATKIDGPSTAFAQNTAGAGFTVAAKTGVGYAAVEIKEASSAVGANPSFSWNADTKTLTISVQADTTTAKNVADAWSTWQTGDGSLAHDALTLTQQGLGTSILRSGDQTTKVLNDANKVLLGAAGDGLESTSKYADAHITFATGGALGMSWSESSKTLTITKLTTSTAADIANYFNTGWGSGADAVAARQAFDISSTDADASVTAGATTTTTDFKIASDAAQFSLTNLNSGTGTTTSFQLDTSGAIGSSPTVSVNNGAIKVTIAQTGATVQSIVDAINKDGNASSLVKAEVTSGVPNAMVSGAKATTQLTGGVNAVVDLTFKDENNKEISTTYTVGSGQATFSNGLSVIADDSAIRKLAAGTSLGTTKLDIVKEDSKAAISAGNGNISGDATVEKGILINTQSNASAALSKIDNAINKVSSARSNLGAVQNRLEHTISNLSATQENMTAAESSIRDVDMAAEMSNFTKNQILSQAATAMLAQANQVPQGVLKLLG